MALSAGRKHRCAGSRWAAVNANLMLLNGCRDVALGKTRRHFSFEFRLDNN
jgi:hypothetical protein